jgi:plastocyanin
MTRGKLAQLIYNSQKTTTVQTQQQTQQTTQQNWQTDWTLNVNIEGFAFKKDLMTIGVGTNVKWTNKDTVDHQVVADGGEFSSPILKPGATWTNIFNTKGTFNYHCSLHPTMKGSIIVKPANEVPTI